MCIKQHLYCLILSIVLFHSFNAASEEIETINVVWATDNWQGYTNKDGTGLYHELFSTIFANSPYNITVKYLPWKRALNQVKTNKANISGGLPNTGEFICADVPILTQPISILMPKQDDLTLNEISNLMGVWPEMYSEQLLQPKISPYIKGISAHHREDALTLLQKKKVNYYIDIKPMLEVQLSSLPKNEQQLYKIQNLDMLKLFLIFSDNPKGLALKAFYEQRTKTLLKQKVLQGIYQKYQLQLTLAE